MCLHSLKGSAESRVPRNQSRLGNRIVVDGGWHHVSYLLESRFLQDWIVLKKIYADRPELVQGIDSA